MPHPASPVAPQPFPPTGTHVRAVDRRRVRLFGIPFTTCGAADVLAMAQAMHVPGPRLVVTANIDHILSLSRDRDFRRAYAFASFRTLDGMPLVWLARTRGRFETLPHRVTGHDLLEAVVAAGPHVFPTLFLVAPSDAVSAGLIARLTACGWPAGAIRAETPPFGFEHDAAYGTTLAEQIRAHASSVLLMGVGAPKSEIWVQRAGPSLGSPIVLCIGDALAVGAGKVPRAPAAMQRLGLEWVWRFGLAPRRLFYRYFVRSWLFPWMVLTGADLSAD